MGVVHTKKPKEDFTFTYRSQYAVKKEEYGLKEKRAQHFFTCEEEQTVYFKIAAETKQEIEILIDSYEEELQLCDEKRNVIQTLTQESKGKISGYRGGIYRAELPKKGTYYIKIVKGLDTAPATEILQASYILYKSI